MYFYRLEGANILIFQIKGPSKRRLDYINLKSWSRWGLTARILRSTNWVNTYSTNTIDLDILHTFITKHYYIKPLTTAQKKFLREILQDLAK